MKRPGRAKRNITLTLLALVAVGSTAVVGSVAANANEDKAEHNITSEVFGQPLKKFLADYPNAERQSDGTYELERGMVLVPDGITPAGTKANAAAVSRCAERHLCFFQNRDFEGSYVFLTPQAACGRWYGTGRMTNATSSIHNNMNSVSSYFGDTTRNLTATGRLGPNSYWSDLDYNKDSHGRAWNDRIDRIMAGCR